jgi:hypothetical protein
MQRPDAMEAAANVPTKIFPAVLLLCLAVSGCGSTCVSGFWNGSGSGVKVSNTSCPLSTATGAAIVQMSTTSAPPAGSAAFPAPPSLAHASPSPSPSALPSHVQHIFLTLRGIEAHPSMTADEDSSGWQELAPDLAAHPLQLDVIAQLDPSSNSPSLDVPVGAIVPATVPAEEYRQLRLRLLPRDSSPDELIPESNACGNAGWNCIVFADRSVRPLEFAPSEFDAAASVFFTSNAAVRLAPVFRVVSRSSSPAATAQ